MPKNSKSAAVPTDPHAEILRLTSLTEAADSELCDAANFLSAEGGSARTFHRCGRELHRTLSDAYMRIGADSASTGPVTPEAIRALMIDALALYHRALEALNDDLRAVSKRLP